MLNQNETLDRAWCKENTDRLMAWEMLKRTVLHETSISMTNEELCDTIGVSSSHTIRVLNSIKDRLNAK